ncbi:MAG: hypothetical protein NVS1B2_09620 [Vulcanimicrobiaceae bacterium]
MDATLGRSAIFDFLASLVRPFRFRSDARLALADYLTLVVESYDIAARQRQHETSPSITAILDRIPKREKEQSASDHRRAVAKLMTWSDAYAIERETVELLPDADVPGELRMQRVRYAQIVSASEYGAYLKTAVDLEGATPAPTAQQDASPTLAERQRNELRIVITRINYMLTLSPPKDNVRGRLTLNTIAMMFVAVGFISVLYVTLSAREATEPMVVRFDTLFAVLLAGLVGGFVSVQQRLEAASDVDPLFKRVELESSGWSIIVSPVIGMIFACVFAAVMMSGLLEGSIFPKFVPFDCSDPRFGPRCTEHGLWYFSAGARPGDIASWAKLIVWSFAAGFLERLVPDIITRLSSVATTAKTP